MQLLRPLLITLIAVVAAACATPSAYAPKTDESQGGYSESRIETNRWRVTFAGNTLTGRDKVETFLLYRAAELTLANGFDHFIVADRATDEKTRRLASVGHRSSSLFRSHAWYFHPRLGWVPAYDPFAGLWDDPYLARETTRYTASAEIAMFKGPKPPDRADAFDARDVVSNLAGKVIRPEAAPPAGP